VAEYEALVLGLRAAKGMGIQEVAVFGDAELVVQQIKKLDGCCCLSWREK
jgi:ribonuclease HI